MNRKFDIITMILMAILCIMLVFVVLNYFMKTERVTSSELDSQLGEKDLPIDMSSGDEDTVSIQNEDVSGEITIDANRVEDVEGTNYVDSTIIKSNDDISSKEKREVLQELDQTLMELFDVVDKVTIVDETRLITDESGDGQ